MPHLYTTRFETYAKVIKPTESDRFLAHASLQPLRALLSAGTNVENSDDVLYIAAAGAVAGMVNRNLDGITAETALAIYGSALNKYINIDHSREKVVGAIISTGLTKFGTNEPLTKEAAAALNEPFNMAIAGVVWKSVAGQLARYLVRVGDDLNEDALSLSWEIAFNRYSIGQGSRNLWDARLVGPEDAAFESLNSRLRTKGGNGKGPDGEDLFRVIEGDAIILGYSIVPNPAAAVRGILPITESAATPVADVSAPPASASVDAGKAVVDTSVSLVDSLVAGRVMVVPVDTTLASVVEVVESTSVKPGEAQVEEKIITLSESRVTPITAHSMKIESLAHLTSQWSEIRKLESAASVEAFVQSFQAANEKFVKDLEAQTTLATDLAASKTAAEKRAADLEASLAQVQKQVEDLKAAQAAAAANVLFQERMASFDEQYDLDDEDREMLAADVRLCADEAAFAGLQKKCAKLMAGKKKGAAKASTATSTSTSGTITAATVVGAVASITEVAGQTRIPNGTQVDVGLEDEMAAAFGSTVKIGGKTVKDIKAAKLAAAPKE